MYRLDQNDVQRIFHDLVRDYPAQAVSYLQPQTFAAIRGRGDVFLSSFDKTKLYELVTENQGLFYSRAWDTDGNGVNRIDVDFPVAFLLHTRNEQGDHRRPQYKFLFGVLDLEKRASSEDQRVIERKYADLELIARSILNESMNYVYAKSGNQSEYSWQPEAKLKAQGFTYHRRGYFDVALKNQNQLAFEHFEDKQNSKEIIGVLCELRIEGALNLQEYSY